MIYRLRSYHGGLGDELQFSTLPELLTKQEGSEVYLLGPSNEVHPFRNEAIKKFVWGKNPYILGEINGEWNCGDLGRLGYKNTENDFIKNWERAFGLDPENSLPKVYTEPKYIPNIKGIIELSALSFKYDKPKVIKIVERLMSNNPTNYLQIVNPHQSEPIIIPGVAQISPPTIFDIYDLLCSCKEFISLSSGTHSMAAAARRHNNYMRHFCILPDKDYDWTMTSKKFVYPNIHYLKDSWE